MGLINSKSKCVNTRFNLRNVPGFHVDNKQLRAALESNHQIYSFMKRENLSPEMIDNIINAMPAYEYEIDDVICKKGKIKLTFID